MFQRAWDLDSWPATIVATEVGAASRERCAAVEALIFPGVLDEAPGAVTRRVRRVARVLGNVDADALRTEAAKERWTGLCTPTPARCPG